MSYADYILRTGERFEAWEHTFGRYLYRSRFQGLKPILDIGPGRAWFMRQARRTSRDWTSRQIS